MSTLRVNQVYFNDAGNASVSIANSWNISIVSGGKEVAQFRSNGDLVANNRIIYKGGGSTEVSLNTSVEVAFAQSNAAFTRANTSLSNSTGTFAGALTVTSNIVAGNLTVSGATIHTGPTTFTGNVIGNLIVTGTITDNLGGLRILPIVSQSAYYALSANDIGKIISFATGNVAIPNAVFTTGDNITIYNNSAASINVVSNTSVTAYLVGTATTGTRILAQRGLATVICVAANTFVVTGGGLT